MPKPTALRAANDYASADPTITLLHPVIDLLARLVATEQRQLAAANDNHRILSSTAD